MDGLSVTASVIAVLQVAEAAISVCCDYRASVRGARWEVPRVLEQLRGLRSILRKLEELADQAERSSTHPKLATLRDLCDPNHGELTSCFTDLTSLEAKLQHRGRSWTGPVGSKRNHFLQAMKWPFQKSETEKVLQLLDRYKSTLNVAVSADQMWVNLHTFSWGALSSDCLPSWLWVVVGSPAHRGFANLLFTQWRSEISLMMDIYDSHQKATTSAHLQHMFHWLDAPDSSSKYYKGLSLRHKGTGTWFTGGTVFTKWLREPNSFIWLSGFAGNGKTVLSSSIIEDTIKHASSSQRSAVAYYYFAFDDTRSQPSDAMVRALVVQLATLSPNSVPSLDSLYSTCSAGQRQPAHHMLMSVLHQLIVSFDHTYIICDALDECGDRNECMDDIKMMISWALPQMHFLATSRAEKDIEDSLETYIKAEGKIRMDNSLINEDIKAYIEARLQTDSRLKRWQSADWATKITTELSSKADGMFRWVVCQLDTIIRCLSGYELEETLKNLPQGLDDTYERIFSKIDQDGRHATVYRMLQFLIHSEEILTIRLLAETITLDMDTKPYIDLNKRLLQIEDVLSICSGLVEEQFVPEWGVLCQPMRVTHFSIQEFLLSPRIKEGPAREWFIDRNASHVFMTQAYLTYLLHFDNVSIDSDTQYRLLEEYPLAHDAAQYLMYHARLVEEDASYGESAVLDLFRANGTTFLAWLKLICKHEWQIEEVQKTGQQSTGLWPGALQLAAEYGLYGTVERMLDLGADIEARSNLVCQPVNRSWTKAEHDAFLQSGPGSTALIQASYHCRPHVVQLLLERGADVNAGGGGLGYALATAVRGPFDARVDRYGDVEVVRLLLSHGADVHTGSGLRGGATLLQDALGVYSSAQSKDEIVELLIEHGADVNVSSPFGSLLEITACHQQPLIARRLLKEGISIESPAGINSLVWASRSQVSNDLISDLLASGVNLNARASDDHYMEPYRCYTPLEAACNVGAWRAAAILLDKGAGHTFPPDNSDMSTVIVNALNSNPVYSDDYEDAATLQLLLAHGADIDKVSYSLLTASGRQKYKDLRASYSIESFVREYKGVQLNRYKPSPEELGKSKVVDSLELPIYLG